MLNDEKLDYYKKKLLDERRRITGLLGLMKKNATIDVNLEVASELSLYDNHTGDTAAEINDMERGRALKNNEVFLIKKIDGALHNIYTKSYGVCKSCKQDIPEERLEFIPYAEYCVKCQEVMHDTHKRTFEDRPVEEAVLNATFSKGHNDNKYSFRFSDEDSNLAVQSYNRREKIYDFYNDEEDEDDGYVEAVERISNSQYKETLP
ncbi:MAG: TraR/DksA C4-type zinc finger protein [Clostridiaceae bacterium]